MPNNSHSRVGASGSTRLRILTLAVLLTMCGAVASSAGAAGGSTVDGRFSGTGVIGPGGVVDVTVTGRGGVPASGVDAVAVNVTATNPLTSSFLTVWPTGQPRPTASNLNFSAGQTIPNMVVAKVGVDGQISIFNLAGTVDVIVDVLGWFPVGGSYTALNPARLLDTRSDLRSRSPISAGEDHSLVLKADGTVWGFGFNVNGQAGPGSTSMRAPAAIPGLTSVVAVSGGSAYSLALRSDGTVWTFGASVFGGPGLSRVPGLSDITAISAGTQFAWALRADGTVWGWGSSYYGQLGTGAIGGVGTNATPVQVLGLTNVVQISASSFFGLALRADGTVWALGGNYFGNLGNPTNNLVGPPYPPNPVATRVLGLTSVTSVSAGSAHSLALRSDGTVWAFGSNLYGELGTTLNTGYINFVVQPNPAPRMIAGLSEVTAISAGNSFSVVLRKDGTVWGFGANASGQLGTTTNNGVPLGANPTPTPIPGLTSVVAISAGGRHTLVERFDGTVWSFGDNVRGQLGTANPTNTLTAFPTPTQVPSLFGAALPA